MRARIGNAVVALVVCLVPAKVGHADEGELWFEAIVAPEVAWLAHPAAHDAFALLAPFGPSGTFTFLPRVGAAFRYGLHNQVILGVGVDGAAFANLRAADVTVRGVKGDLFTGTYAEVCTPLALIWRFDSGYDLSGTASVAVGPMGSVWAGNALADPKRPDAAGLPSALPVEIDDALRVGGFVRLAAAFEARLFDVFGLVIEPSAGFSFAGSPGLHFGIALRGGVGGGLL